MIFNFLKENIAEKKNRIAKETAEWEKEKPLVIAEQDLKEDKINTKNRKKNEKEKKNTTTTKRLMFFLFLSCSIIQIFTLVVTIVSMTMGVFDFTPLQMLITTVVGEVVAFAVYSLKSLKENTKGGIVYDTAMLNNYQEEMEENEQEAQG